MVVIVILILSSAIAKFGFGENDNPDNNSISNNTVQSESFKVSFIDVGQGDCTLVTCGDKVVLIDGGEYAQAQTVINYLKNEGISKIDCCIATHPHSDHIGSLGTVLPAFELGDVIMPDLPESLVPTTTAYEKFLTAVSDNAENVYPAEVGEKYSYGDINIQILAPVNDYDDLNNMSIVAKITYKNTSVMIAGDAESKAEKDILKNSYDYSADILKLGHHGSRYSSTEKWLQAVNPQYAVISCGLNNDYGHPHSQTLDRLDKLGIEYFRTDALGTIVFVSDGDTFTMVTDSD